MIKIAKKRLAMQPATWFPDNLHKLLLWTWLAFEAWRVSTLVLTWNFSSPPHVSPLNISPELRISSFPTPFYISLFHFPSFFLLLPLHFSQGLFLFGQQNGKVSFPMFLSFERSCYSDFPIFEIQTLFVMIFVSLFYSIEIGNILEATFFSKLLKLRIRRC